MTTPTLHEKAAAYSLDEDIVASGDSDRQLFIDRFPIEKFSTMSLDEFASGTGPDSFCHWLEYKKIGVGIGGGNASKFGVYKPIHDTNDNFATGFSSNKKLITRAEATVLYENMRSNIALAFEYVKSDRVEQIIQLDIPMWNMVLQKILTLYFPDKFLKIASSAVIIKCARALQIQDIELKAANMIAINYACMKALRTDPAYAGWSNEKIGMFMWENFQEPAEKKADQGTQYWLYAPGENARLWDEFYEKGIMGLGWDKLGDIRQFETKEDIKKALVDIKGGDGSKKNDVGAIFDFLNTIRIGDYIIAKRGMNEIIGYGIVTSDYEYDSSRSEYQKIRKVDWKKRGEWSVDFRLVLKTLTNITDYNSEHTDFEFYHQRLMALMSDDSSEKTTISISPAMQHPLNTIFYGPPGTGKTYHTVQRAAEIIEGRTISSHSEALAIFKQNLHDRIEFITFHQNYSYEDFIQGLRPDTRDENDQLLFTKSDGVFKKIADRALKNLHESKKKPIEISREKDFEQALQDFIEHLNENDGIFKITDNCRISGITDTAFRYGGENWSQQAQGRLMKFNDLKSFFKQNVQTRKEISQITDVSALAVQHATYFFGVYQEILKYLKPGASAPSIDLERKNYVIVVDEINRANISRVFGELITLIEPDKRSDGAIPLEVKLPSGDRFMIPSNLYIIGTMNTADKSIALLDIALRRRFEFESMYPKYEMDGKPLDNAEILRKINEQIIKTKGYDFQIGHAYFMGKNESLQQRMNNKVIPLLLEYYMNDEKEVRTMLGEKELKALLSAAGLMLEEKSWPLRITGINA
jgi:5-methylcytosine-specific restriction protein B